MKPLFRIKICGITRVEDAQAAVEAGADAIGLNFFAGSPRFVNRETAYAIRQAVPKHVCCVGVFVNAPLDEVAKVSTEINFDALQFHGDEPPEYLAAIRAAGGSLAAAPVIRAFRCRESNYAEISTCLAEFSSGRTAECHPCCALIDAHVEGKYGGAGQAVDWQAFRAARSLFNVPLILAGGLTAENVAAAVHEAHPDAVDVASGVETALGKKNPELIRRFVENARRAFQRLDAAT